MVQVLQVGAAAADASCCCRTCKQREAAGAGAGHAARIADRWEACTPAGRQRQQSGQAAAAAAVAAAAHWQQQHRRQAVMLRRRLCQLVAGTATCTVATALAACSCPAYTTTRLHAPPGGGPSCTTGMSFTDFMPGAPRRRNSVILPPAAAAACGAAGRRRGQGGPRCGGGAAASGGEGERGAGRPAAAANHSAPVCAIKTGAARLLGARVSEVGAQPQHAGLCRSLRRPQAPATALRKSLGRR